jgi:hypothetical protein
MPRCASTHSLCVTIAPAWMLAVLLLPARAHADGPVSAEPPGGPTVTDPDLRAPNPDGDLPPGFHREQRPKRWPLVAGGLAFGAFYLTSAGIAALDSERSPTVWLNVPVVGPWIFVARWKGPSDKSSTPNDNPLPGLARVFGSFYLIVDGGIQAAGLVLLAYGALSHDTVIVNDLHDEHAGLRLAPMPMVLGPGAPGFGVVGAF